MVGFRSCVRKQTRKNQMLKLLFLSLTIEFALFTNMGTCPYVYTYICTKYNTKDAHLVLRNIQISAYIFGIARPPSAT